MHPFINVALSAARPAGEMMIRAMERLDAIKVNEKSKNDFVTDVDEKAEAIIIDHIRKHFPNHAILAEESGSSQADDTVWIIDPLDGTTNFIHGFPHFAISIGVQHKGRLEHGLVYDPFKQEVFSATRGSGAQLNGRRLRVSSRVTLENALIATGLPYRHLDRLDAYMKTLTAMSRICGDARRTGSAALDLAYVAAGRLDGYWECGLHAWDLAAGAVIVREAGGMVTDQDGMENFLDKGDVVAANPKLIKKILNVIMGS